jgi:ATP-dependent RNA helicase DeaD
MDYSDPTPIQEQAIPPMREGRDVLGQAQTGTGKTAGFGIPLIEGIDTSQRAVQAIVLVPTRELCLQVADELSRLGRFSGVRVLTVYGGVGFGKQLDGLTRGSHIVVGTPGRVEDLLQRGSLRLDAVRVAILDEADRMLDVGFLPAIERILKRTPSRRQTALFSATIPEEIRGLANRQMREPVTIFIDPERATVDEIEQRFERVPDGDKLSALQAYLDDPSCFLALVFRRTTYKVDRLVRDLQRRGYKAAALHGRRSQNQRERVLGDLRSCKLQVLVATDIAARGLDITGLTHVFNFDLPDTPETYVHRIGRTGRAGETGTAVTFVAPEDADGLRAIERYLAGNRTRSSAPAQSRKPGAPRGRGAHPQGNGAARGNGGAASRGYPPAAQGAPSSNGNGSRRRRRRFPPKVA